METVDLAGCSDDELRELTSRANRGQRQVAGYLARLAAEARARERAGGSSTAEDVIRGDGEVSRREAEQVARRADLAEPLPETGQAGLSGDARPANLDLLGRELDKLTPAQRAKLARQDSEIAQRCRDLPPETFARYLKREIAEIRRDHPDNGNGDELSEAEKQKAASRFDLGRRSNGRWWCSGDFDHERGAVIDHLINQLAHDLGGDDGPTSNTRAAALFNLIAGNGTGPNGNGSAGGSRSSGNSPGGSGTAPSGSGTAPSGTAPGGTAPGGSGPSGNGSPNGGGLSRSGGPGGSSYRNGGPSGSGGSGGNGVGWVGGVRRMAVGVIVDALTLAGGAHAGSVAQTWDGDDIDPRAAGRLACDADLYAILLDRLGAPIRVGRTRRAATREQRLALRALYNACPLDGTPFGQCQIHHVNVFFEDGGLTELDNLVPISGPWHHRIHDRGWTLHMARDRTLTLRRPDGTTERSVAPPTPLTRHGPPHGNSSHYWDRGG